MSIDSISESPILSVAIDELQKVKKLADKSIAQLSDDQLHFTIDPIQFIFIVLSPLLCGSTRHLRRDAVDFVRQ